MFHYKLSAINRKLELDGLPQIKRQQIPFLMGKLHSKPQYPLEESLHYTTEQRGKYTVYFYSDKAVEYFYSWSINLKHKRKFPN